MTAIAPRTGQADCGGRERERGRVLRGWLAHGYGGLVKMQGFSRAKLDFGFGFSTPVFSFHSAHRIDKLIFAFKLKIYICTMIEAPATLSCGHSGVIHIKYRIFLISRRISILRFGARLRRQLDDVASFAWHSTLIRETWLESVGRDGGEGGDGVQLGEWLKLHNLHYEITFLLFYFSHFLCSLSLSLSVLFHFHFYYYYILPWPQSTR